MYISHGRLREEVFRSGADRDVGRRLDSRAWHIVAAHGGLLVDGVRAMIVSGVDGRRECPRIVHRSMLRKSRHRDWRSVAGWLAGCIHCIVEPDQASGGGPDRKYREMSWAFLGVGGSTARRERAVGGGRDREAESHTQPATPAALV
jgi:hypothetical protein